MRTLALLVLLFYLSRSNSFGMKPSSSLTFEALRETAAQHVSQDQTLSDPRSQVLRLGELVGLLCSSVLKNAPSDPNREPLAPLQVETEAIPPTMHKDEFWSHPSAEKDDISSALASLLYGLFLASSVCDVDLHDSIIMKMELNGRKYPVELCQGKSGKYTAYSSETGITKTSGQSTVDSPTKPVRPDDDNDGCRFSAGGNNDNDEGSSTRTFTGMATCIRKFATDRKWSRYHTPRSIVLALMGELGELAEIFQWNGDHGIPNAKGLEEWTQDDRDHVEQEFADVAIYLLRLCDVCNVDVGPLALLHAKNELL